MTNDKKPFHNAFEALSALRARLPDPPQDEPAPPGAAPSGPPASARVIPRAVVRIERSGRGGKEVTVIEHLGLSPADRETWMKDLKAALGCGGSVEGEALTLQGDQRPRLAKLLTSRGVKKITMG